MNSTDLHKVASFMGRLHEATQPDDPGATRARRALTLGGLGAGLGAAGGYLHTANQVASSPFNHPEILAQLVKKPNFWLDSMKGGLAGDVAMHKHLAPAIARSMPKKLALPALAVGGLGGLVGLLSKVRETTPRDRLKKLRG